jgi:hypothetical protein
MQEIAKLRDQVSSLQGYNNDSFLLRNFLDESTTYAESVIDTPPGQLLVFAPPVGLQNTTDIPTPVSPATSKLNKPDMERQNTGMLNLFRCIWKV